MSIWFAFGFSLMKSVAWKRGGVLDVPPLSHRAYPAEARGSRSPRGRKLGASIGALLVIEPFYLFNFKNPTI
jgi:hypothetical protein